MNHKISIEQPGLHIRITQSFSKRHNMYRPWLDTWVTLTQPPTTALGGVLGRTLPGMLASAAGAGFTPISAGILSCPTA